MRAERTQNIVVRVSVEEQEMARRLSEAADDPISRILRRHLRQLYVDRFGDAPVPTTKATTKTATKGKK